MDGHYFIGQYILDALPGFGAEKEISQQTEGFDVEYGYSSMLSMLFQIAVGAFAAWLSWQKNEKVPTVGRCLYAFFAFIFAPIYLLYYVFRYKLMA